MLTELIHRYFTARSFLCTRTPDQAGLIYIALRDCTRCRRNCLPFRCVIHQKPCAMAEYSPLISHSQTDLDNEDEDELLKADGKVSHQSNIFHTESHITLVFAVLMAVTAISVAAALHISILSPTSRVQPMRSPNDITLTLPTARPDTNLQHGRAIMKQKGSKSESHRRGSDHYPLTCTKSLK
jgi:hypothetical protein